MQLFAFGVNHHTAPLEVREQVAFSNETLPDALRDLVGREPVNEAAILSTCNRTEIYCNTTEPGKVVSWLAGYHKLRSAQVEPYIYTLPHQRAAEHAFRVASGLDSMVLGEPQILGQIKQAVKSAAQAGTLGLVLHKLFQLSFSVAKNVRTHTDVGANSVSMAAAAVKLAQRIYPSIAEQRVLFIGAGEMVELCASHFGGHRPRAMTFANRTVERARELARIHGGSAVTLAELPDYLALQDIVVTSTASPLPIIGKGVVERALKVRRRRPMLMIDLAVPRDIEAEVGAMDDVFLYTVDDLGKVVREGLELRQAAANEAEAIISAGVADFMQWLSARELVPTIRALRDQAERVRRHETERALRRIARGEDPHQVLEALSRVLTNKFLHPPTHALNQASGEGRDKLVDLIERIYQVHPRE